MWEHTFTAENVKGDGGVQLSIDGEGLSIDGGVDVRLNIEPRTATVELPELY